MEVQSDSEFEYDPKAFEAGVSKSLTWAGGFTQAGAGLVRTKDVLMAGGRWGPDKSRVSAYWPHGLLCLSCHCVGWVFPLNSGEPKCVGAKKLIHEPPQSNDIHPSKRTNVV